MDDITKLSVKAQYGKGLVRLMDGPFPTGNPDNFRDYTPDEIQKFINRLTYALQHATGLDTWKGF